MIHAAIVAVVALAAALALASCSLKQVCYDVDPGAHDADASTATR